MLQTHFFDYIYRKLLQQQIKPIFMHKNILMIEKMLYHYIIFCALKTVVDFMHFWKNRIEHCQYKQTKKKRIPFPPLLKHTMSEIEQYYQYRLLQFLQIPEVFVTKFCKFQSKLLEKSTLLDVWWFHAVSNLCSVEEVLIDWSEIKVGGAYQN